MAVEVDKALLLELLDRVIASWWTLVATVCLGLAGTLVALHTLPKAYEARTKVLVIPQKIPNEYVRSTVSDDLSIRMASLEKSVLSRPYMLKLIQETLGSLPSDNENLERMINAIRGRVKVRVYSGLFEISYRDADPAKAATVVNMLADTYIYENALFRSRRAAENTKTLEDLANRVWSELESREKKLSEFKSEHLYETPERQEPNLQMLSGRQRDLDTAERSIASLEEQLTLLGPEPAPSTYDSGPAPRGTTDGSVAKRRQELERQLKELQARYSDEHPEVKARKRDLEQLLQTSSVEQEPGDDSSSQAKAPADPVQQRRDALRREIQRLRGEQIRIRKDIATYEARIEATPRISQQLSELNKGYEVLAKQYNELRAKVESARNAQKMEESQKGEQFEVIERAVPSAFPVSPVPWLVFMTGQIAALLVFVGPIILATLYWPIIRSESSLVSASSVPLLVTIPRVETAGMAKSRRARWAKNLAFSLSSVAVLATVVALTR